MDEGEGGECLWVGGVNRQLDEGERASVCGLGV